MGRGLFPTPLVFLSEGLAAKMGIEVLLGDGFFKPFGRGLDWLG